MVPTHGSVLVPFEDEIESQLCITPIRVGRVKRGTVQWNILLDEDVNHVILLQYLSVDIPTLAQNMFIAE